jgi:hypothetical protein
MTVQLETLSQTYACNGATVAFGVPFRFDDAAYVKVWHLPATGSGAALAQPSGFAVVASGVGWNVVTVATFPTGDTLTVYRDSDPTQPADFTNGEGFDAPTMDGALDRLARLVAESKAALLRSVRLPPGMDGGFDPRAHLTTFIGIDSGGNLDFTDKSYASPSDLAAAALLILQPELDAAVAAVIASIDTQVADATAAANAAAGSAASAAASQAAAVASAASAGAASTSAQAAAATASGSVTLAQQWAAQLGTTVDGVSYSAAQSALFASDSAQSASDAAGNTAADVAAADASAQLARLLAAAPQGVPVTLPDGSVVFSALSAAGDAANIAKLAASLPVKDVTEGTLRADGVTPFIASNVLLLAPEDLFWTIHMKNASACQVQFPVNLWTRPNGLGFQSLAAVRFVKLAAGAVTFAAAAGAGVLDPTPLLSQWWTYRAPTVPIGGAGEAAQDRTLAITVPAGTNRKLVFAGGACYLTNTVSGRDCTLAGTGLSSVAHPVAGNGSGFFSAGDPNRLDLFTATLADATVPTTHTLTFHTPIDLLTFAFLIEVCSNTSALGTPVAAQSPSTGHVDVALTPPEVRGRDVWAFLGQGNPSDPIAVSRVTATVISGGKTGGTAQKDIAYVAAHELRLDTSAQTCTGTEAGAALATPVLKPTAGLGIVFRPVTVGGGSVLTADASHTTLGVANSEAWIEAHSDGVNGYLHGEGLT